MANKVQIKEAVPILPSLDLDATAEFYARLGFVEDDRWPDEYLILSRDDGEIHFWACDDPELSKNTSCYLWVEDAAALYAEYLAQGIEPMKAPEQTDYDILEFTVTDPHGNLLRFGSDSTPPAT